MQKIMRQNSEGGSIMITDEQIVKDWNLVKRCENCANRGPTTCTYTGDGPRHECWCQLKGNPGPLYPLYGAGCSKWKLCKWIRENYERKIAGETNEG